MKTCDFNGCNKIICDEAKKYKNPNEHRYCKEHFDEREKIWDSGNAEAMVNLFFKSKGYEL
jgi:hypothetical protein